MDYKIKFEYKGIGKQATQARQKAIQAQKTATTKAGGSSGSSINQNKELISSINKLIDSNKKLEAAINRSAGRGSGGGGGVGGGGAGAGIGRVGSSMGFLGAGIAAMGFGISKAQQVANANISLKSQQLRTAGMGGFRYGQGLFGATETGAGMAAYGRARGTSARNLRGTSALGEARKLSTIYGMGLEETGGIAGTFERAGGNLGKTAAYARGSGIDSDMPILLKGLSSMMEDAITAGLDASDMSKDMGKQLSLLTRSTPGKSAAAAMGVVKTFQGVQQQVVGGKFGTYEGMAAAKATQKALMEDIQSKGGIEKLVKSGALSKRQAERLQGADKTSWAEITKAIGPEASFQLLQRKSASMGPAGLQAATMKEFQSRFGTSVEGKQQAYGRYRGMGGSMTQAQFDAAWQARITQEQEGKKGQTEIEKKGMKGITSDVSGVTQSGAGSGAARGVQRESLVLSPVANRLANASIAIEKQLISMAETLSPSVKTLASFEAKTQKAARAMGEMTDSVMKFVDEVKKKGISGMMSDAITGLFKKKK